MLHKVALAVASAAVALSLTLALAATGFAPGAQVAVTDAAVADVAPIEPGAVDTAPTVQIDTVYLAPPPRQETVTIHKVVKTAGGENENESGGDD